MIKSSHAARLFLPLVISLGGTAYGQLRPRPQSPSTNTTPVITQPLSKTKLDVTINPSLTSAPTEMMEKAFREVIGRDPMFRGELSGVTKYVLKGVTYNCIPPSNIAEFDPPPKFKRTEWDCKAPIKNWLKDTPEGQAEYRAVYARAFKEVFGLDADPLMLLKMKPEKLYYTKGAGHDALLPLFTGRLYGFGPPDDAWQEWAKTLWSEEEKAKAAAAAKKPLSPESTAERAFLQALKRKPTEADMKALIPVFKKERATFSRMVYILKGLESLKNLKL